MFTWILIALAIAFIFGIIKVETLKALAKKYEPQARELFNKSKTFVENSKIPGPSIAEQEKIVAELDCLSGIIEKKKQQLKEYDALAQSIFYEMFGDPVENEKGWEVNVIGNIANFYNGAAHEGEILEKFLK